MGGKKGGGKFVKRAIEVMLENRTQGRTDNPVEEMRSVVPSSTLVDFPCTEVRVTRCAYCSGQLITYEHKPKLFFKFCHLNGIGFPCVEETALPSLPAKFCPTPATESNTSTPSLALVKNVIFMEVLRSA